MARAKAYRPNKIQVFKGKDGKWRWRLRWSNGEIGSSSEKYVARFAARKSAFKLFRALTGTKTLQWEYEVSAFSQKAR